MEETMELPQPRKMWQTFGSYEHEVSEEYFGGPLFYTGWYRCVGGRLADGRWPMWHPPNTGKAAAAKEVII
jgi:hypothetical protein